MDIPGFGRNSQQLVIDSSSNNLKVLLGSYNPKTRTVKVDKFGIIPLESETINDGIMTDTFGVIMALKHALAKLSINTKSTILTIEGGFMHTRDLELPVVKPEQLKDMVKYEILGQSTNRDMIVEYIVYGKTVDEETRAEKLKVRATAIPVEVANDYKELLKNTDLTPYALDVNPNAIRKLFNSGMINGNVNVANSTLLLIELTGKTTTITVLDKGFPVLSRRLQFGHGSIRTVAESIKKMQGGAKQSSLARRLNITKSESDLSVPVEDIDVWHESLTDDPSLQSAVNSYFKSLTDAVSRTAQFSISKYHIDSISTCFLYGSGAGYKKIDKELSRQLGTQVEILNTLSSVDSPRGFEISEFVNCCGALIRD